MPRKTKREKIVAEYRRRMRTVEVRSEVKGLEVSQAISHLQTNFHTQQPTSNFSKSTSLVKKDLKKTLFLSTLAISLEFVLYWLIELR